MKYYIDQQRSQNPNLLLLNAGKNVNVKLLCLAEMLNCFDLNAIILLR